MCTLDTTVANATAADFGGSGVRDLVVSEGVDPYTARVRLAISDDGAWMNRPRNRMAILLSRR